MNLTQRLNRLEQDQPRTPKQGFFLQITLKLLISVVDNKGNDLYGYLHTFTKPYGSTEQRLTPKRTGRAKGYSMNIQQRLTALERQTAIAEPTGIPIKPSDWTDGEHIAVVKA